MADTTTTTKRVRRPSSFVDALNGILTLTAVGLLVLGGAVVYVANYFHTPTNNPEATFVVESGNSIGTVAQRLEEQGLVANRTVFQYVARAMDKAGELRAGEYRIPANSSMANILTELTEGRAIQYGVTIPEGRTSWEAVQLINADANLTGEIAALPPEGSILPNTYNYERGATRQSVVDKMTSALQEQVAEIWANRDPDLPLKTPEELVILASIVEKETGIPTERDRVAAVFVNRIRQGMRLQSDPTIIYGITNGQGPLGRGLRRSEIERETPYNTYQINGLPPTPIANPGIESLRATANPADTNDLYFVADGSGGHAFAETYEEHQRNVARWREIERAAAAAAADAANDPEAEAAKDELEAEQAEEAGQAVPAAP